MQDKKDELTKELLRVFLRSHHCKPKFKGNGDLANIEFFMLMGLSGLLEKNKKEGINGVTLGQLIQEGEMTMSAASRKISILEGKGYVKRETALDDRRKVYITLTQKGQEICNREKEKKYFMIRELITQMGNEEVEMLIMLSNRAVDILEKINQKE